MTVQPEIEAKAVEFASAERFHQKFTYQSKEIQGPLTVSYAVAGAQKSDAPAVLFCGGMYSGRMNGPWVDYLAEKKGVKVIMMDRPGIGRATPVPITQRVAVWLETVPALLAHLEIKHVALASHSCGVIYLFNTIYYLPEILLPTAPTAFILAPWVHPSKSGVKILEIASCMPSWLVSGWNKINIFMVSSVAPSLALLSTLLPKSKKKSKELEKEKDEERRIMENCGLTKEAREKSMEICIKMLFAEETKGASDEAMMALKTDAHNHWGVCEDYSAFVPQLAQMLRGRPGQEKLQVRAFFAENDFLVGKGGKKYFDGCWKGEEEIADIISFESIEVAGVDHDGVGLPENEILGKIFEEAKKSFGAM